MNERIKDIIIGIFLFFILVAASAFIIDTLLIEKYSINENLIGSIYGGILSFLGGAIGALGAYFVSVNQTRKEFERRDNEMKTASRPIINCTELNHVSEDLSNIKYSDYTILLSEKIFITGKPEIKVPLYIIHFLGNFKMVLNVEISIVMDNRIEKTYPIGGIKQDNEILLSVPLNKYKIKKEGTTDKIIINYVTENREKFKYVYDNTNLNECYYLISNDTESLLEKIDFKTGTWQIPGRYNKE